MRVAAIILLSVAAGLAVPARVLAQAEAPVGVRAVGMGGAFTAVADDASAVFWNPAGLASGSYFSLVVDRNGLNTPDDGAVTHGRSGLLVAAASLPLGFSYYRTRLTTTQPYSATALQAADRNTLQGEVRLDTLVTDQIGAAVVQSVGRVLAVGGTLKFIHGTAASGLTLLSGEAARHAAKKLPSAASWKVDGDLGVMAALGTVRVGLTVRNVGEPSFETTGGFSPLVLQRQVRGGVGLAIVPGVTLAADFDITTANAGAGRWRDAAIGGEAKVARGAWIRSGVHWNAAGGEPTGAAPIVSVGGSYTIHGSIMADAQASLGSKNGDRGWGVGVRLVF